jgi:hypothetical protein
MLSGLGRTSYPTNPEGLTAPADIAAAAETLIDAWERGEAAAGETVARAVLCHLWTSWMNHYACVKQGRDPWPRDRRAY